MEVARWKRRDERGSKRIAEPRALAIKQVLGADDQTRRATESAQIFQSSRAVEQDDTRRWLDESQVLGFL
jgi:hypothetical protein